MDEVDNSNPTDNPTMTSTKTKRVALYLRVSTDEQTTENQSHELEAIAGRSGWNVVEVYEDHGISGAKGRDKRPALDKLMTDATRRRFDIVASMVHRPHGGEASIPSAQSWPNSKLWASDSIISNRLSTRLRPAVRRWFKVLRST